MNDTMQVEEKVELPKSDDSVEALPAPAPPTDLENDKNETSTCDDGVLKGTALLKSLLSTSTASTVAEMIITTEVTDETLNLKKILYQADDDDKEQAQNGQQTNNNENVNDNDDDRLVIDISDEEKDPKKDSRVRSKKSMPSLNTSFEVDSKGVKKMTRPTSLDMKSHQMRQLVRMPEGEQIIFIPKS